MGAIGSSSAVFVSSVAAVTLSVTFVLFIVDPPRNITRSGSVLSIELLVSELGRLLVKGTCCGVLECVVGTCIELILKFFVSLCIIVYIQKGSYVWSDPEIGDPNRSHDRSSNHTDVIHKMDFVLECESVLLFYFEYQMFVPMQNMSSQCRRMSTEMALLQLVPKC